MHQNETDPRIGSRWTLLLPLLVALLAGGCGGGGGGTTAGNTGGGGGGSGPDLTGYWIEYRRATGSGAAYEPEQVLQIDHTGSTLWMDGYPGTSTATTVDLAMPSAAAANRWEYHLTVVSKDVLEGVYEQHGVGFVSTDDVRFDRTTAPSGTFSASGTVLGKAVSLATGSACAVEGSPWTGQYQLRIADTDAQGPLSILLAIPQDKFAIAGGVIVGSNPGETSAWVCRGMHDDWADVATGFVIFTALHGKATGTFDFTMDQGSTKFTGAFDVPILVTK